MKTIPLFKSHFSIGKSILTLDKPIGNLDSHPVSIIDLAIDSKLESICLVEDNMTSFLEATKQCNDKKIKLIFGLRVSFTKDILSQDEASLKSRAKYIIFAKNIQGYKSLIKIWSIAAQKGFYYNPCLDFSYLKNFWNDNLLLAVPFYDSFLHLNSFESHFHIPEFGDIKPTFFLESQALPFDPFLREKTTRYCEHNGFDMVEAHSIFYKSKTDFIAYLTFRCISERTTIEKPEFNHMASDTFCYDYWKFNNK